MSNYVLKTDHIKGTATGDVDMNIFNISSKEPVTNRHLANKSYVDTCLYKDPLTRLSSTTAYYISDLDLIAYDTSSRKVSSIKSIGGMTAKAYKSMEPMLGTEKDKINGRLPLVFSNTQMLVTDIKTSDKESESVTIVYKNDIQDTKTLVYNGLFGNGMDRFVYLIKNQDEKNIVIGGASTGVLVIGSASRLGTNPRVLLDSDPVDMTKLVCLTVQWDRVGDKDMSSVFCNGVKLADFKSMQLVARNNTINIGSLGDDMDSLKFSGSIYYFSHKRGTPMTDNEIKDTHSVLCNEFNVKTPSTGISILDKYSLKMDHLSGTATGDIDMGTHSISSITPKTNRHVANKEYVDDKHSKAKAYMYSKYLENREYIINKTSQNKAYIDSIHLGDKTYIDNKYLEAKTYIDTLSMENKNYIDNKQLENAKQLSDEHDISKAYTDTKHLEGKAYTDNRHTQSKEYIDNNILMTLSALAKSTGKYVLKTDHIKGTATGDVEMGGHKISSDNPMSNRHIANKEYVDMSLYKDPLSNLNFTTTYYINSLDLIIHDSVTKRVAEIHSIEGVKARALDSTGPLLGSERDKINGRFPLLFSGETLTTDIKTDTIETITIIYKNNLDTNSQTGPVYSGLFGDSTSIRFACVTTNHDQKNIVIGGADTGIIVIGFPSRLSNSPSKILDADPTVINQMICLTIQWNYLGGANASSVFCNGVKIGSFTSALSIVNEKASILIGAIGANVNKDSKFNGSMYYFSHKAGIAMTDNEIRNVHDVLCNEFNIKTSSKVVNPLHKYLLKMNHLSGKANGNIEMDVYSINCNTPRTSRQLANKEYVDTKHSTNEQYIDDRCRKNKKYIDYRYTEAKTYTDEKHSENKKYIDDKHTEANTYTDNKLTETKTYIDNKHTEANTYTDNKLTETKTYIDNKHTEANTYTDNKLTETKTYIDNKLTEANTYTDNKLTETKTYTDNKLTEANTYTDNKLTETKTYTDNKLTEANTYTDNKHTESKSYTDEKHTESKSYTDEKHTEANTYTDNKHTESKSYTDEKHTESKSYTDEKHTEANTYTDNKHTESKSYTDEKHTESKSYTDEKHTEANTYTDNKLTESKSYTDEKHTESKSYTDEKHTEANTYTDNKLTESKSYTDEKHTESKSYTDEKHTEANTYTDNKLTESKSYTDEKHTEANTYTDNKLTESKSYTDEKHTEANTYTDNKHTESKSYTDEKHTETKTYTDNKLTEAKTYTDNKQTESKSYTDEKHTESKSYTDDKHTEANTYTDNKHTESKSYTDEKHTESKSYTDDKHTEANTYTDNKHTESKSYTDEKHTETKTYTDNKLTEANTYTDNKQTESKSYTDEKHTESKSYTEDKHTEANTYTDNKHTESKAYTDDKLTEANTYTDNKHTENKAYTDDKLTEANTYTDNKHTENKAYTDDKLTEANTYTDNKHTENKAYTDDKLTEANTYTDNKHTESKAYTDNSAVTILDTFNTTIANTIDNYVLKTDHIKGTATGDIDMHTYSIKSNLPTNNRHLTNKEYVDTTLYKDPLMRLNPGTVLDLIHYDQKARKINKIDSVDSIRAEPVNTSLGPLLGSKEDQVNGRVPLVFSNDALITGIKTDTPNELDIETVTIVYKTDIHDNDSEQCTSGLFGDFINNWSRFAYLTKNQDQTSLVIGGTSTHALVLDSKSVTNDPVAANKIICLTIQWNHVGGTNASSVFCNGVKIASFTSTERPLDTSDIVIGSIGMNVTKRAWFDGNIYYFSHKNNHAMTHDEIINSHNVLCSEFNIETQYKTINVLDKYTLKVDHLSGKATGDIEMHDYNISSNAPTDTRHLANKEYIDSKYEQVRAYIDSKYLETKAYINDTIKTAINASIIGTVSNYIQKVDSIKHTSQDSTDIGSILLQALREMVKN